MSTNDKNKKGIIGIAGEYFVAAELSRQGIIATLTMKNTPYIDILATNFEKNIFANIQVKTKSQSNKTTWSMSLKDQDESNIANHFYVLVDLKNNNTYPEYFIISKLDMVRIIKKENQDYMSGVRRDGTPRKENTIRTVSLKSVEKFKDRWDLLKLV